MDETLFHNSVARTETGIEASEVVIGNNFVVNATEQHISETESVDLDTGKTTETTIDTRTAQSTVIIEGTDTLSSTIDNGQDNRIQSDLKPFLDVSGQLCDVGCKALQYLKNTMNHLRYSRVEVLWSVSTKMQMVTQR